MSGWRLNVVAATVALSGTLLVTACGGGSGSGTPATAPVTTPDPASGTGNPSGVTASTLALTSGSYSINQTAGSVTVTVARNGTGAAVGVNYATSNGTAQAGTDYTATSGSFSWTADDSGSKSLQIPVSAAAAFSGTRSFTVTLSSATGGASLGTPTTATITITGSATTPPPGSSALSIKVSGDHLVDASGATIQLRGADVSGLEFTAIQGWSASDPWGGQKPNWQALKSWKLNAVRIPLNEASWLGLTTYDWPTGSQTAGVPRNADPGNNYRQTVTDAVNAAVAAGMYVILDLHLNSPDANVPGVSGKVPTSPTAQNVMADADHSVDFWTSVAGTFKGNPAVIFDLFNEPHMDGFVGVSGFRDASAWVALRDGGTATQFVTNSVVVSQNFQTVGMQALLNAVRSTGATNVVMAAGISWAQDTSQWTTYAPQDPIKQLAASWHAYPGTSGSAATLPGYGADNYTWATAIHAAGFPVIVGETGDQSANGTATAPFMVNFLPWLDQTGTSVLGWSWNAWGGADNDLIKDVNGTPTDGYGTAFHAWTTAHQ